MLTLRFGWVANSGDIWRHLENTVHHGEAHLYNTYSTIADHCSGDGKRNYTEVILECMRGEKNTCWHFVC